MKFECQCGEESDCCNLKHKAEIARFNAKWHRKKFKETGDRYYLGQWKAYSRVAKRLYEAPR